MVFFLKQTYINEIKAIYTETDLRKRRDNC